MKKEILYVDMDGVVADFDKAMSVLLPNLNLGEEGGDYEKRSAMVDIAVSTRYPTIFEDLEPIKDAIEAVEILKDKYDIYFLSTPMNKVPDSYAGKRIWIQNHFGEWADKRLILTHRKDLVIGDILIDDRFKNGSLDFRGEFIRFGSETFPNWTVVLEYLLNR